MAPLTPGTSDLTKGLAAASISTEVASKRNVVEAHKDSSKTALAAHSPHANPTSLAGGTSPSYQCRAAEPGRPEGLYSNASESQSNLKANKAKPRAEATPTPSSTDLIEAFLRKHAHASPAEGTVLPELDYASVALLQQDLIGAGRLPRTGSVEYYDKLAPIYGLEPSNIARGKWLTELINQYGLWVGLGHRSMTAMDYAAGTGLMSQALAPHVRKILAIDSSKGMVDQYNATVANEGGSSCEMQAVHGDLVSMALTGDVGAGTPDAVSEGWDLIAISLGIDFFTLTSHTHTELVKTLEKIILCLIDKGIILIIDIEKVRDGWRPAPGIPSRFQEGLRNGKKYKGYGSSQIAAALLELEMDDIQVMEDQVFKYEATKEDEGLLLEGHKREETYFLLRARKGARFARRMRRKWPGYGGAC